MKDDLQFNEDDKKYVREYKPGDEGFPPRSTIHNIKDDDAPKNNKLSKIVFSTFGFLIVIVIILVLVFANGQSNGAGEQDPGGSGTQVETPPGTSEEPKLDPDDIVIETPEVVPPTIIEPPKEVTPTQPGTTQPPVTPEPPATTATTHTVKSGDNMFAISVKYYESGAYVQKLAAYNNISDPAIIIPGTILQIPNKELLK